jgi:hypothetical protein
MILAGPLAAGDPVIFDVVQNGFGPIGQVKVSAGSGEAEAPWRDFFHPARVQPVGALAAGARFPTVTFTFTATAQGRPNKPTAPLAYGDDLSVRATYSIGQAFKREAVARPYVLHSPWGTRSGKTLKAGDADGCVLETGLPPGGASVVLGESALLSAGSDGELALVDQSTPLGDAQLWRFCDVKTSGTALKMSYRILAATPDLSPPSQRMARAAAPTITFRVRRLVTPDFPRPTVTPTQLSSDPYLWQSTFEVTGGSGWVEVTVLVNGTPKNVDTFLTGLPLNAT